MKTSISFYCLFLLCMGLFAQSHEGFIAQATVPLSQLSKEMMPPLNNQQLLADELAARKPGRAPKFAETFEVQMNPQTHGQWEILENGNALWRLRIHSAKAKSINLGFSQFYLPKNATLILYSPDQKHIQGPFTAADNADHGQLWTPVLPGDEMIVELQVPQQYKHQLLLELKSVNHDFLGFAQLLSGSCNLDVICGAADGWAIVDQYRDIIRSVGVYGLGGGTFCTGFLINNTNNDCAPFFMTAEHCGISSFNAPSVVVYWNYENSTCRQPNSPQSGGNGDGMLTQFNSGSTFRASWGDADFCLIELDSPVPTDYNPFFAGFDATATSAMADSVICVHHPNTEEKRISFEFDSTTISDINGNPNSSGNYVVVPDWDIGTTEGGSSGSPLFNKEKRVIGQLFGGFAACGNNDYDVYGWIHRSWDGGGTASSRLRDWLDPGNTGILIMDGKDCGQSVSASPLIAENCKPNDVIYELIISTGFADSVDLSLNNLPGSVTATFSQNPVLPGDTVLLTLSNTITAPNGSSNFQLNATDGTASSDLTLFLISYASPPNTNLVNPPGMATGVILTPVYEWNNSPNTSYEIEVAADPAFTNIVENTVGISASPYNAAVPLLSQTTYYWRVRGENICGQGLWSEAFSFTTGIENCVISASTDVPVVIDPVSPNTVSSDLMITNGGAINDLNINNLVIDHTWVSDLTIALTSPSGTDVVVYDGVNCDFEDLVLAFDDEASMNYNALLAMCSPVSPAISGTFQPFSTLSAFDGEEASGTWTLTISDNFAADGGQLVDWELDICTIVESAISTSLESDEVCEGTNYTILVNVGNSFDPTNGVTLSTWNLPAGVTGTFAQNPATPGAAVDLTLAGPMSPGSYNIGIIGTDGQLTDSAIFNLTVLPVPQPMLQNPPDASTNISLLPTLDWMDAALPDSFIIEIALDSNFTSIVQSVVVYSNNFNTDSLDYATLYYWRVQSLGDCGPVQSEIFSFATLYRTNLEAELNTRFTFFPNPASHQLQIKSSRWLSERLMLSLYSLHGQALIEMEWYPNQNNVYMDLSGLSEGVYLVEIRSENATRTERIIIQR